jgi:hypothetical protein
MVYATEMTSGGIIYVPNLITVCSGIRVILRVLPQQLRGYSVAITDERYL